MDEDLSSLELAMEYRTGECNLVERFYIPCLTKSMTYDRSVGYFRSSVFGLIGESIVQFAKRGGKMRLICSPDLTDEDREAISQGYVNRAEVLGLAITREIDELEADVSTKNKLFILSTLITVGTVEVKLAFNSIGQGIYHEKIGIFGDQRGNFVSFKGSSNESWSAWHEFGNVESFDVFASWHGGSDALRATRHRSYFALLWDGNIEQVETLPFPEVGLERLRQTGGSGLEDIPLNGDADNANVTGRTPLPHQIKALDAWADHGYKGIFQHATGSGKTFTALLAIREHCSKGLPTIILVPSSLLFKQWMREVSSEIPNVPILAVGDGNNVWRRSGRIEGFSDPDNSLGPRIILAMMQTAAKPEFLNRIAGGEHLLVVADEVHRLGSSQHANVFRLRAGMRLGLSATPRRYGDPNGTARIFDYFGEVVPPVITLKDAIENKRLVPYQYFPHTVHLNDQEMDLWTRLTKQISVLLAKQYNVAVNDVSDDVKRLLIKRARIAKKADAKVGLATSIIEQHFKGDESWLVYCDDIDQLDRVSLSLRRAGYSPMHYYTSMQSSHSDTLEWFSRYGGILLSIRCLDEGVDIPSVSHALILASSQNPREFIQRRGRVLRKDPNNPNKTVAVIHDALVVPEHSESEVNAISLVKSEIARALEFSQNALNPGSQIELVLMATKLGIDIDELSEIGMEVDENDQRA